MNIFSTKLSFSINQRYYNETQIESLIFSYGFKDGAAQDKETIKPNVNF